MLVVLVYRHTCPTRIQISIYPALNIFELGASRGILLDQLLRDAFLLHRSFFQLRLALLAWDLLLLCARNV